MERTFCLLIFAVAWMVLASVDIQAGARRTKGGKIAGAAKPQPTPTPVPPPPPKPKAAN